MMDVLSYALSKKYTDEQIAEQKLKVAKVEKELNDYKSVMAQVNINQEAKQKASGYGIVSLPKNAAEGQISVVAKGLTATNLVKNGNFANGATNWSAGYATISVSQNTASIIGTGTNSAAYITQKLPIKRNGQKLYARMKAKVTNSECKQIELMVGMLSVVQANPVANTEYFISGVLTMDNDGIDVWCVPQHVYDSAEAAAGKVMEVKEVMVIDLTATFGAGNEPDKETCDKIFANWFDATKSTLCAGRFRAVGKNLFDPHKFVETVRKFSPSSKFTILDGEEVIELYPNGLTNPQRRLIEGIFKPNTQYTISFKGKKISSDTSVRFRIFYTDGSFTEGAGISNQTNFTTRTTVSTAGKTIDFIGIYSGYPGGIYMKEIQLEEGATATAYEPYRENNAYVIAKDPTTGEILEARSLPNGTKDEFNVTQGKFIKRVSDDVVIDGNLPWVLQNTNEYRTVLSLLPADVEIYLPNMMRGGNIIGKNNDIQFSSDYPMGTIGRVVRLEDGYFYIALPVPNGTLEDAKNYLNTKPVTLNYQLATPLEIPIQVSGTLVSYPSGTVYVEPFVADAGLYNNGITVLHQDLPIKSIEKISKIDYETGIEYELDKSKVVINTDKLSLTHPDLQNGDIVFFIYEYDKESTIPEIEVEFYDSRYVVKDSATGKFYKWSITVTNGTPSIQLTEV